MSILFTIFFFLFGLIVGSFLNVVILRYNTGKGIKGRSQCLSCRAKLAWLELIPLFSFLAQKGRCRHCLSKISWQYPLVELATAVSFSLYAWFILPIGFSGFSVLAIVREFVILAGVAVLIAIAGYDLRHKIIPDHLVLVLIGLSFLSGFLLLNDFGFYFSVNKILNGLLGGMILYFFFWSLWKISNGTWMGLGDAKLSFAVGLFLGLTPGLTALILAFWIGAVVGILLIIKTRITSLSGFAKYFTIKSELPFAPFITLGAIVQLISQFDVFKIIF